MVASSWHQTLSEPSLWASHIFSNLVTLGILDAKMPAYVRLLELMKIEVINAYETISR